MAFCIGDPSLEPKSFRIDQFSKKIEWIQKSENRPQMSIINHLWCYCFLISIICSEYFAPKRMGVSTLLFFCLRDIEGDLRKKRNDSRLVNEITRRNPDHHVCFLGFHHPRDQVKCSIVSRIPWIKLYFSSIAWVIKMERIHYERQHKLEQIATEMYKNSVLVSEPGGLEKLLKVAFKSIRIKSVGHFHEFKTTDEQEEMNGALWDVDVVEESWSFKRYDS